MADSGAQARTTKGQHLTAAPFVSHVSVQQALETNDPAQLQAALAQIDNRAAALNAKPQPRAQPDLLLDYLKHDPACQGVFASWDLANKTNNSPLAAAVLSCLASLVRLASTDPFNPSPELVKTLLSTKYAPYFDRSLNPGRNDVTTASLKLCNVLVGFGGGRFARRVFGCFSWSPKVTSRLYKTRLRTLTTANALAKPDIRTLLVLLVLGFLSAGDVRLKGLVLETKGLLAGAFKGLDEDPEVVVNLVLETVGQELVVERRVGLEARRNMFDEACMTELVKLYDYPQPEDDAPLSASHPSLSIDRFFRLLKTWLADQIASSPLGRSSGPQRVLSTLLRSLKVTEDPTQRALGLDILAAAPVLAGAFWAKFPSSLDPRLSSRWVSAITFATQVVALPVADSLALSPTATPDAQALQAVPSASSILDAILPPSSGAGAALSRSWYTKALAHETPLVSFLASLFLLAVLQKASAVLTALADASRTLEEQDGGRWAVTARRVRDELRARLPDPAIVVSLMTRTAAAASAAEPETAKRGGGGKAKVKGKGKGGAGGEDKEDDSSAKASKKASVGAGEGALLRTNVALRLLFLYHRVAPQLVAALKFDFAKLPQTYARAGQAAAAVAVAAPDASTTAEATAPEQQDEDPAARSEGLRAISSAYALRLAAAHTSSSSQSAAAFARPADYYKQTLAPLFELYRVPATPSNRTLLGAILRRQLGSAALFGPGAEESGEVDTWLRALPVPREEGDEHAAAVLDAFERAVRETLTKPLQAPTAASTTTTAADASSDAALSPLMRTALAHLAARDAASPPGAALLRFFGALAAQMVASERSLARPRAVVDALESALEPHAAKGEVEAAVRGWRECLAVAAGEEAVSGAPEGLRATVEAVSDDEVLEEAVASLSPRSANVFVALEGQHESLERTIAVMPIPLVFLHARTADLANPAIARALVALVVARSAHLAAAQVLLHRFVGSTSQALADFIGDVYRSCGDLAAKKEMRERIAGSEGLLGVFARESLPGPACRSTVDLLGAVLDASRMADKQLVDPFCSLVLQDLAPVASPTKKRKHKGAASTSSLSPRILAAGPLLPFFDTTSSLPLLDALLAHLAQAELDPATSALLAAALERVLALPPSAAFTGFWTAQFERLNALAGVPALAGPAGAVLEKGANALRPEAAFAHGRTAGDGAWRVHAVKWTDALLAARPLSGPQAATLAALVARSAAARARLVAALDSREDGTLAELAKPLEALVETAQAKGTAAGIPEVLAARFVGELLESHEALGAAQVRAAQLLVGESSTAAGSAQRVLDAHVAKLGRDEYRARDVALVARLAETAESLKPTLVDVVEGTLDGLVRRFAEPDEDRQEIKDLTVALTNALHLHADVSLKSHSLDPLVTNLATRRLEHPYAVDFATALTRHHRFKDNEVTRHLNEIFASPRFATFANEQAESVEPIRSALTLVLALATSSVTAAANARVVDRLVPFYHGTLSTMDRALLDLFQRVELVGGASISPALKAWNPSTDSTALLDGTRVGALGAAQKTFVRRSWARAFASSRTVYTAADDERTYDPLFIVGFVAALAEEDELKPQEWTTLLESGVLGTVVAALASSSEGLRGLARATLAMILKTIQSLTFREKDELHLVLTQVRLSIYSSVGEAIPASIALFLAHCVSLVGAPASPLYPAFMRFLLQRSTVDSRDVPMFYTMLYSSNADEFAAAPRDERVWMVRFLTEGLVRTQDWKIYRRRQVFEILASVFQSSRQDPALRKLILEFLLRATSLPSAARELMSRNGFLGWLAAQAPLDVAERRLLVQIVANMVEVVPFEQVTGVTDAVEALENAVGGEVAVIDPTALLDLIRTIAGRLPATTTRSALLALVLARLTTLLSGVANSSASSTSPSVQHRLYATTMLLAFVRNEAGIREGEQERKLWRVAVQKGLEIGDEELRREVLRTVCE
ncbi:hypothetical protein JCM3775_004058 [Rhodotorula graminis]